MSLTTISVISAAYFNIKHKQIKNRLTYFFIKVYGAVDKEKILRVNYGEKIDDILKRITVSVDADLKKIDKNVLLKPGKALFIPFKNGWPKLKANLEITLIDLTRRGVKLSIAKKIMPILNKKGGVTWSDLSSVQGVGSATMRTLHRVLEID